MSSISALPSARRWYQFLRLSWSWGRQSRILLQRSRLINIWLSLTYLGWMSWHWLERMWLDGIRISIVWWSISSISPIRPLCRSSSIGAAISQHWGMWRDKFSLREWSSASRCSKRRISSILQLLLTRLSLAWRRWLRRQLTSMVSSNRSSSNSWWLLKASISLATSWSPFFPTSRSSTTPSRAMILNVYIS